MARFASEWKPVVLSRKWTSVMLEVRQNSQNCFFWFPSSHHGRLLLATNFPLTACSSAMYQVNTDWSFGQIVAITVWIPAIAEYIFLPRCETCNFLPSIPLTNEIEDAIQEGNEYRCKVLRAWSLWQPKSGVSSATNRKAWRQCRDRDELAP